VSIEPEYRTSIKTFVTGHHIAPVAVRERIVLGATVPQDIELLAVADDWGPRLNRCRYVYPDNHVIRVVFATSDPSCRLTHSIEADAHSGVCPG